MRSIRVPFVKEETEIIRNAVLKFNKLSVYLSNVKIREHKNHNVLYIPLDESAVFASYFLEELTEFSKLRFRRALEENLKKLRLENHNSDRILSALMTLKHLSS